MGHTHTQTHQKKRKKQKEGTQSYVVYFPILADENPGKDIPDIFIY